MIRRREHFVSEISENNELKNSSKAIIDDKTNDMVRLGRPPLLVVFG